MKRPRVTPEDFSDPWLRTLVVALVCADGHTLTSAGLARRLWENPPPGAADTLRSHVSHVRGALCRAAEPGDHLRAGQVALRLDQYGQAAGHFRDALALCAVGRWPMSRTCRSRTPTSGT